MSRPKTSEAPNSNAKPVVGRNQFLPRAKFSARQYGLVIVGLLIVAGGILLFAAGSSPFASLNADQGTLANGATVQSSSAASDGKYVQFGNTGSGSCPLSAFTATNQPACLLPFSANSPFNFRLPDSPKLAPYNASLVSHMQTYNWIFQGGASGFSIHAGGSRAVYFAHPTDPLVKITSCGGCSGANKVNILNTSIHIPNGASPTGNTDGHMTVVETDTGNEYDFWQAGVNFTNLTMTSSAGGMENINTDTGVGASAGDAAYFPLLAGLLRPSELLSGQINHALVIDLPCTGSFSNGYVWPAIRGNGETCGSYWTEDSSTAPLLGQLVKLNMTDAQIAASAAPAWEKTIMTALAHYGAYAEDTNGSSHDEHIYIFSQDSASWTKLGAPDQWSSAINTLSGGSSSTNLQSNVPIPTSALQVIDPCVPQKNCP